MTTFVALGDSITLGVGDPIRLREPDGGRGRRTWRGWAALLADGLCDPVLHIVAGNGACSVDVERDQLPHALQLRPDIASVVVGVNDTLRPNFEPDRIGAAAGHTVGALRAAGAEVLTMRLPDPGRMLGMPGVLGRPLAQRAHQINAVMDDIAGRFGTLHFDAAGDEETYDPRMWAVDRLHPSERGHRLIARRFHALLARAGYPVGPEPDPEPGNPPPTRLAELAWLATKGTAWVMRRSTDLVPNLLAMAFAEWRAAPPLTRPAGHRLSAGPGRGGPGELPFVGMTWQPELDELRRRQELAGRMGGPDKIRRQHEAGRLTVRERIAALLDEGSFHEIGAIAGAAAYDEAGELSSFTPANFVTGTGRLGGRKVVVGGDDFTVRGGAADAGIIGKQIYAEQLAHELRLPMVRLVEGTGGGGSVKTLEQSGHTYVPVNPGWDYVVDNLSTVPVVAAGLGPVAGLGAARLCAAHLSILVEGTAQLFVAGPPVVRSGVGEDVDKEQLGGSRIHARNSAVDLIAASEADAFALIRAFLSYLPPSVYGLPPVVAGQDPADREAPELLDAIPRDRRQPYRIRPILTAVFDAGSVLELQRYGGSIVTAFARLDGHPVGVVACDPYVAGGCLTVEGSEAVIRLADLCSAFHLPIVTFTDQPGLLIGTRAEQRATIRFGVRAISAVYQATVPGAEIIVRRVFGVGGAGLTNRHRPGRRWAWPSADWGSLPVEGGIEAAYRADLERADDPAALLADIRTRLDAVRNPMRTAERFGVEEIIDPRVTRPLLCDWVQDAYAVLRGSQLGKPSFGLRP